MVKRIKKVKRRPRGRGRTSGSTWLVPFDAEGKAGIWIHAHGDSDDHGDCGPVVMCCERCVDPYKALAPDLVEGVESYRPQTGGHLGSWLEGGVGAMYFVLCDPDDPAAVYQFGLPEDQARALLLGRVGHDSYRRPDYRFTPAGG